METTGTVERVGYNLGEFARLVGITHMQAYQAAVRGELPTRRIGERLIVPRVALEAWLRAPAGPSTGGAVTASTPGRSARRAVICVFVYEQDAARQRHLRHLERCAGWVAALAFLTSCVAAQPHAYFAIEAYPDTPGDADGE